MCRCLYVDWQQLQTLNGEKTILTINYDTGERYLSIEGLLA